ncbi:hypothetical protein FAF44_02910 [Nonomuraea sp. MG754425]|uniref:hypothetical protein n=1 Tax=Nonomuraea sp. MG754425 TaxID=2570319 RepID=UPI001F48CE42|nr:hypothetical protein [Nonomuraea sp. MG754425]MCF6467365.1 hypothetical protein [Nonomuraea sp. MG754425]
MVAYQDEGDLGATHPRTMGKANMRSLLRLAATAALVAAGTAGMATPAEAVYEPWIPGEWGTHVATTPYFNDARNCTWDLTNRAARACATKTAVYVGDGASDSRSAVGEMVVHWPGSTSRVVCRNGAGYGKWVKCPIDADSGYVQKIEVGAGTYGNDGYHNFRAPRGVYPA